MKKLLLFYTEINKRVSYLESVIGGRYEMLHFSDIDEALAMIDESGHDIAAVIIDNPSDHPQADILLSHLREVNSYMLAIPALALTDEAEKSTDALLLDDTMVGVIEEGEPARIVCHRIEKSVEVVNSASFAEFSRMLKALPSLIYLKDTKGRYVFCSQYWSHLEGVDDPGWTIRGKTDMDIRKDKENARKAYESDLRIVASGRGTSYVIKEDGEDATDYLQLIKEPLFDDDGRVKGIIAIINNVTEQELLRQELREKSITDELTGLYNRTYYYEFTENISPESFPIGIISADCDELKLINDVYGHLVGDEYIRMAAKMMKSVLPEGTAVFRMGGDEFLAIVPRCDEDKIGKIMENLLAHEKIFTIRDRTLSVSLGSCIMHVPSGSFNDFVALSDAEMYKNKKEKKERKRKTK